MPHLQMSALPGSAIILFVRLPVPGRVKTRLAAGVGSEAAATFYRLCAEGVVRQASRVADTVLYIFYSEDSDGKAVQRWLQPQLPPMHPLIFLPQCQSPNLGDRLLHALEVVLARGHNIAMVAGSDVPDLSTHHFEAALEVVRPPAQCHATFGPAADGGYYLLALRSPSQRLPPELFDGIVWSTSDVLKASLAAAEQSGLAVAPLAGLPMLRDIDTLSDLEAWAEAAKAAIANVPMEGMAAVGGKQHQQELLALACSILTASRGKQKQQQL